ncbi:MAG: hypothetical protein AB9880_00115 [Christensenellales bacterium]
MANSDIIFETDQDPYGREVIKATRKRGKISIDELTETLCRDWNYQDRLYAIVIRSNESAADVQYTEYAFDPKPGDLVILYPIEEGESCPVCAKAAPPHTYCPNCGEKWERETA